MFTAFTTTGIGSMPHTESGRACRTVLDHVDVPFWPQLPKRSFLELMIPQYAEGMPMLVVDNSEQKVWIDTARAGELEAFYETYNEETLIGISEEYAAGFYAFRSLIEGKRFPVLKGHITGPLTFTLGLKDEKGVPVYFNEELREISLMLLKGKVRWQIDQLGKYAEKVMVFIDEPILSAIGTSSYMGVTEEETRRLLSETVASIRAAGGIAAIHCCGKADWKLVMETGIDVVNFDAFEYFENVQIYTENVAEFLAKGGYMAFGIVPTNEEINTTDAEKLKGRVRAQIDALTERTGFADLPSRTLLTPSCGTGSLSEQEAEKVFAVLSDLKTGMTAR